MPILAPEQLEGVFERLTIAHQNILNLAANIAEFLKPFPSGEVKVKDGKPIITETEHDAWQNIQKAAKEMKVPLSISIRAGEVIHHLRSCLDHIAWQLSDPVKRENKPTRVQFPIVTDWSNPNELFTYKKQTEFISDPNARSVIDKVQPASLISRGKIPKTDPLYILHKMDIVDKHRELPVILPAPRMHGPTTVTRDYVPHNVHGRHMLIPLIGTAKVQAKMNLSLQVAFAKSRDWEEGPVIELLFNLTDAIRKVVGLFAE
jgi:hypothetical protein